MLHPVPVMLLYTQLDTLAGLAWHTTYVEPSLWTQPSPPSLAVQALLPAQNSDGTQVAFREVDLDSAEVSLDAGRKLSSGWMCAVADAPVVGGDGTGHVFIPNEPTFAD